MNVSLSTNETVLLEEGQELERECQLAGVWQGGGAIRAEACLMTD